MKKYFNDLKDILTLKKCPNDFSLFYSFLLIFPIYTIIYFIILFIGGFFK